MPEERTTCAPACRRRPSVKSIPAASLGITVGFLEVVENEGVMELFELSRHVDMELAQLPLAIKAAELLGLITTPGQRVEMTASGRDFLAADVHRRKHLLNVNLRDIFVFNLVVQTLEQSEGGEMDEEAVLTQLAMKFPYERPHRIFRTVVAWARYAELFKSSGTRKVPHSLAAKTGI